MGKRRGIFPKIDKRMHLEKGKAGKHYQHVYRKVLFPGKFTNDLKE